MSAVYHVDVEVTQDEYDVLDTYFGSRYEDDEGERKAVRAFAILELHLAAQIYRTMKKELT